MKLICDACKLTLNARDEDRGKPFQCPICHAALRDADAPKATNGADAKAPGSIEWSGGTIDDLVYMISSQALAAVVEAHAPDKRGEVHLIAGGIDEAYAGELRGDEALDLMRQLPSPRFRVEMRLPNEETGSLATPGPDKGDLKTRPLAQLMRYCESFVLTCDLEVWRANETCKVEYRQGNIARSLVGGVDAPEQLGEVMGWGAGNYRFVLPRLALPQMDDEARAQAKAAAETKISDQKAARKTIFGMPAPAMAAAMAGPGAGAGGGASAPSQPVAPAVMMSAQAPAEPAAPAARPANATMIGMPSMIPQTNRAASSPANPAKPGPANVVVEEAYTTAAKAKPATDPAKTVAASPTAGKRSQPPASQAKASQAPASKAAVAESRPPATEAAQARSQHDHDEEIEAPSSKKRIIQYTILSLGIAGIAWLVVYVLLSN